MKVITQREMRNNSARIMDDVEQGATYQITRGGKPVAELRPIARRRRFVPIQELVDAFAGLAPVDAAVLRAEADDLFDDQGDRV